MINQIASVFGSEDEEEGKTEVRVMPPTKNKKVF